MLIVIAGLVAGCLPPTKANVSVTSLEGLFPIIKRLHIDAYMVEPRTDQPACVFFLSRRGAFSSDPSDEFCRVFGAGGPPAVAFDQQASDDLAELKGEFDLVGVPVQYLYINLGAGASIGPESAFSADRCVAYFYSPGWSALPEPERNTVSSGITADWYKTDSCP